MPPVDHDDLGMRALEELTFRQLARHVGSTSELRAVEQELAESLDAAMQALHRGAAADRGSGRRLAEDVLQRCFRRIAEGSS